MNVEQQVEYWRTGSEEDWEVAVGLVQGGKIRKNASRPMCAG